MSGSVTVTEKPGVATEIFSPGVKIALTDLVSLSVVQGTDPLPLGLGTPIALITGEGQVSAGSSVEFTPPAIDGLAAY